MFTVASAQLRHILPRKLIVSKSAVCAEASLGHEEFCTLFSHIFQRGAVQTSRQLGRSQTTLLLHAPAHIQSRDECAALDDADERAVVLRVLIEEFGGEVVSSTLGRHLFPLARWNEARSDLRICTILGELAQCGALTLEDVNGTDVIARILPIGVTLAYDLPASNHGHRGA